MLPQVFFEHFRGASPVVEHEDELGGGCRSHRPPWLRLHPPLTLMAGPGDAAQIYAMHADFVWHGRRGRRDGAVL